MSRGGELDAATLEAIRGGIGDFSLQRLRWIGYWGASQSSQTVDAPMTERARSGGSDRRNPGTAGRRRVSCTLIVPSRVRTRSSPQAGHRAEANIHSPSHRLPKSGSPMQKESTEPQPALADPLAVAVPLEFHHSEWACT